MSKRLQQIVRKRRLLVLLVAEQRGELAADAGALKRPLVFADVAWRSYRRLKTSPVVSTLVGVGLAVIGPGRLLRAGYRGGAFVTGLLRVIRILRALH